MEAPPSTPQPPLSPPPMGPEVPLSEKTAPSCTYPREVAESREWVVTRGIADVAPLLRKLAASPEDVFEDSGQVTNVYLKRPAHDRWGIKKIMFIFCDDFMQNVYRLPWWNDEEWQACLHPIFEAIGVDPSKVVRCLLASMPPGASIPTHHDTGYWVDKTHRVHVPIVTSPTNVVFQVGISEDTMRPVLFDQGRIVELNNQAKHAVQNNWDQHRIHLIFDYVDTPLNNCITLQPGERVTQTRRSVDLESSHGARPTPSFIVLGSQKCGTTAMYSYLMQHDLVLRPRRRETHFFDWRWQDDLTTPQEQLEFYHKFFQRDALAAHPSLMSGESTPSYLLNSHIVIDRLKAVAPQAKLIVMLRDPVARAFSQYQMVVDPEGTPGQKRNRGTAWLGKSFEDVVQQELRDLRECGVDEHTTPEEFRKRYLLSRPLDNGGHSMLGRGLYALQLVPWLQAFPRDQLLIMSMEEMSVDVQAAADRAFEFVGLPLVPVEDQAPQNARTYDPMPESTRKLLQEFYAPFNRQLYDLLGRNFGW